MDFIDIDEIIEELIGFVPVIIFILVIILSSVKKKKPAVKNRKPQGVTPASSSQFTAREMAGEKTNLSGKLHSKEHTHDRLDFDCYVPETQAEHYKKQLDGFLKAGLIERSEYTAILNRYTQDGVI